MTKEYPNIMIPEKGELSKFVQLDIKGEPYFRVGSTSNHHFYLLFKTLNKFNVEFKFDEESDKPLLNGKEYQVFGMGQAILDDNLLILSGHSIDYKIGPSRSHSKRLQPYLPEGIKFDLSDLK